MFLYRQHRYNYRNYLFDINVNNDVFLQNKTTAYLLNIKVKTLKNIKS